MTRATIPPNRSRLVVFVACLTLAALLACAGCQAPGFVTYVIAGPPKVDAQYILQERPTLVIVDDPNRELGNPSYPAVVGANVNFNLVQNGALPEAMLIPQDRLTALAAELGEQYASTPIDRVGARLGAEQVIYVLVQSAGMQAHNTYYQPTATVQVKVVDAATGRRLFPQDPDPADQDAAKASHGSTALTMTVELRRQTIDETRRHSLAALSRSLAERIGLETAQLFYKHTPEETKPQ